MNKGALNLLVDVFAAGVLTAMVGSGYILQFALPPGSNRTLELWGLSRHEFGRVHAIASLVLLATLALHVALHWRWLVVGVWNRVGRGDVPARHPRAAGAGVLMLAAAPLIALAAASSVGARERSQPRHAGEGDARPARQPDAPANAVSGPDDMLAALGRAADEVLTRRCAECHGADRPDGNVRADSARTLAEPQNGRWWLALNRACTPAALAPLRAARAGERSLGKHVLPPGELAILRAWAGNLAFPEPPERAGGSDASRVPGDGPRDVGD